DDIENGVHRTHLVQMNLLRRHAVDLTFRRGDRPERAIGALADGLRCATLRHETLDVVDVATVRLRRNVEVDLLTHDLTAYHFSNLHADVGQSERRGKC